MKLDLAPAVELLEPGEPTVQLEAFIDHRGQRSMFGVLRRPGKIGRCSFGELRIEVTERLDAGGWVQVVARRRDDSDRVGEWKNLTGAAEEALRVRIDEATSDVKFHDAWFASWYQTAGTAAAERAERMRAVSAWEARWWGRAHVIAGMMVNGRVTAELVDDPELRALCPGTARTCEGLPEHRRALVALRRFDTMELLGYLVEDGRISPVGLAPHPLS